MTVLHNRLRVQVSNQSALAFWVMAHRNVDSDEVLMCSAFINYAGYMVINMYRNKDVAPNHGIAIDAANQFITQSARGHSEVGKFLDA